MSKQTQIFEVCLRADADELALILTDWAVNVQSVQNVSDKVEARAQLARMSTRTTRTTPVFVAPKDSKLAMGKPYKGNAKSTRLAHTTAAKYCAGYPGGIPRADLVVEVKKEFHKADYAETGASSCITQLVKLGHLRVVQ